MEKMIWVISHLLIIFLAVLAGQSAGYYDSEKGRKLAATKSGHKRVERKPDGSDLLNEIVFAEINKNENLRVGVGNLAPVDSFETGSQALLESSGPSFADREQLFKNIFFPEDDDQRGASSYLRSQRLEKFLNDPNHPPHEMLAWVLEKQAAEGLSDEMKAEMNNAFATWVENAKELPPEERVAALGTLGKKKDDPFRWLAEGDVYQVLQDGRDWVYEFRHGRLSAEQVWEEVSSQLQNYPEAGDKGARFALYKMLAEEDHEKAFAVIQSLPENRQREIMYHSSWTNFIYEHPQKLLDFSQSLPPTEAQWELGAQLKGWDWKARHYLARHGDDYVDWVKAMPPGIEKEEALESLVWATREQDRERGKALEKELFPNR